MSSLEVEVLLIDELVALARERLAPAELAAAEPFIRQYYRWVPAEDLAERSSADLCGAVLALWEFAQRRGARETKIRIYDPSVEHDGWRSAHTVIDVLCDDMPFLVDSVTMELRRQSVGIHLMIHPVLSVVRSVDGALEQILPPGANGIRDELESVLHLEVDRESDAEALAALESNLAGVLAEVRAAVEDWPLMRVRLAEIAGSLTPGAGATPPAEVAESRAFLEWLVQDHFTFLGARDYELVETDAGEALKAVAGSGLGILREGHHHRRSQPAALSERARAIALSPQLLVLTKANSRATVHRPSFLDYVGIKHFDADGRVVGERRFLGLYTSLSYQEPAQTIPILRGKLAYVLERAGFAPESHDRKALADILEAYRPRDELLALEPGELFDTAMGILAIGERQRVRLFVHRDPFGRFVSCLVFVPRDRFNTENRERIGAALSEAFGASVQDWSLLFSESVLVRVHYVLAIEPGEHRPPDTAELEAALVTLTATWGDELRAGLVEELGEEDGGELHWRYAEAFPPAYRADWGARAAVADIERAEEALATRALGIRLYRNDGTEPGVVRAKLFSAEQAISLSDILPMLENMGARIIDERPYEVTPRGAAPVWVYDLELTTERAARFDTPQVRVRFQEAFLGVWQGVYENDGLNRLVLEAQLRGREVMVLRAITKYLRQAGSAFSDGYLQQALTANAEIAQLLVSLFRARFDPSRRDDEEAARIAAAIAWAIDAVESLEADRILREYLAVVHAMTRTDYFQASRDGAPKPSLCFKLDPTALPLLPAPRPSFEVFVYSPRVEGVHLRGGRIARGGLRWSDRREDFRTEVLDLMKAQMVKNAVIVPFGAKGGFVVKRPPAAGGGEALHEEVVACYETFVSSLLDITDNIEAAQVVPPRDVVRHDGDDPYLVVAADRGTATFSDTANAISAAHSYWLGDAFASGGSVGYDHKKMAITSRGAWESVKRHFRELGRNIMASEFTVVGIGDMSGDVFGNGMLLSPHTLLLAAFNHEHVFIDPNPDAAVSLRERRRLFELPGSAWSDYDASLISAGGGVYARSAKSIALSEQARAALGVEAAALPPDEVIRALLRAPVDLLWNGGIGTYVKAAQETNADVGDKANDALRIDGRELRCRVVGEGGNLGFTQRGRIEYAISGGLINTDAIDNVGGVNCSDREVNIKILLDAAVAAGELSVQERNALLVDMTAEVASLVLRDSYTQSEALSLAVAQAPPMLDVHARMIRSLEQAGSLQRALEALPDEDEIAARRLGEHGLTSPELAVLMAHAKIRLNAELLDSDLPEDPYLEGELELYFPAPLPERFAAALRAHRLRREIIATHVTNEFVDTAGVTAGYRLIEETGASAAHLARCHIVAREAFGLREFWAAAEALDDLADARTQLELLREGRKLLERATRWLLRNRSSPLDTAATIEHYAPGVQALALALPAVIEGSDREAYDDLLTRFQQGNIPPELASRAAAMGGLLAALDIVEVAGVFGRATDAVARVYFRLGDRLALHWLRDRMTELPRSSRWQGLARAALRDDLGTLQRELTMDVFLASSPTTGVEQALEEWESANAEAMARCTRVLSEIRATRTYDVTTLSVALREARNLLRAAA